MWRSTWLFVGLFVGLGPACFDDIETSGGDPGGSGGTGAAAGGGSGGATSVGGGGASSGGSGGLGGAGGTGGGACLPCSEAVQASEAVIVCLADETVFQAVIDCVCANCDLTSQCENVCMEPWAWGVSNCQSCVVQSCRNELTACGVR